MKNKVQVFFDSMCNSCQDKFKKVISVAKRNALKDLDDLQVFLCNVDKNRSIEDDNGLVPLAFIFCKKDSYVFFWKEDLYNGDGSIKLKLINNTIILAQATIERIKENTTNDKAVAVVKKEETHAIASKLINENNNSLKNHFSRQMLIMNRQHLLYMSKIRKLILILGLSFALILGAAGGVLGWYFTRLENKIGDSELPNIPWRINLNEHFANTQLGKISDNKGDTILVTAQNKNSLLQITDLLVKDITDDSATVYVKSSSNIYDYSSSVKVYFFAQLKTLETHTKKLNFSNTIIDKDSNENELLNIVKKGNQKLRKNEVIIENIHETFQNTNQIIIEADLVVKSGSEVYLPGESLKLYFSNSNRKMLSEVLTNFNLGDIKNIDSVTILKSVQRANENIDISQIEIPNNTINKVSATIKVKEESQDYIRSTEVIVYYRVFNPNIGVVDYEINQPNDQKFDGGVRVLQQISDDTILAGTYAGSLYRLNINGTIKNKIDDPNFKADDVRSILKLDSGNTLVATNGQLIYEIYPYGSVKNVVKNKQDIYSMTQLKDGSILGGSIDGNIYKINENGQFQEDLWTNNVGGFRSIIQLHDKRVVVIKTNGTVYFFDTNGNILDKVINQFFPGTVFSLIQLQDGTILVGTNERAIVHLNDDGTIKGKVQQPPEYPSRGATFYTLLQLKNQALFTGTNEAIIYKLKTE
ncbi:ligand-binding sensor domain-containing protein [Spiroplasma chrysopicola]|uniref:Uncharacterized protein n=1 Tax=Spiroplasma chrysopicola DF-1 TaxID=1276227 RepID=R4UFT3_9MOLU|nr:hypothetical protein [Spiroplasma chrysopicola]AGM25020.1 hypothetical protein SCHRY_v1c04390 [Spiroplasma chrysopicola DF-1]